VVTVANRIDSTGFSRTRGFSLFVCIIKSSLVNVLASKYMYQYYTYRLIALTGFDFGGGSGNDVTSVTRTHTQLVCNGVCYPSLRSNFHNSKEGQSSSPSPNACLTTNSSPTLLIVPLSILLIILPLFTLIFQVIHSSPLGYPASTRLRLINFITLHTGVLAHYGLQTSMRAGIIALY
jgi:hypothetical protein